MLSVTGLSAGYGDLIVLRDIELEVRQGEFVALVGSNAAGKSTLLRAIVGLLPLQSGRVALEDTPISGLPAYAIAARGVSLVLELSVLRGLSVEDNLLLGAYRREARPHIRESLDTVYALFPVLAERRRQLASSFSGGQQQMLCIGRALMSRPKLLMLDEPSVGLAPAMVATIFEALVKLNRQGVTILLVEQNVAQTLRAASRGYVLENGRIVLAGSSEALLVDPQVRTAYLGL
jgi:branched-chain amino acid transport system ATP-binding protein